VIVCIVGFLQQATPTNKMHGYAKVLHYPCCTCIPAHWVEIYTFVYISEYNPTPSASCCCTCVFWLSSKVVWLDHYQKSSCQAHFRQGGHHRDKPWISLLLLWHRHEPRASGIVAASTPLAIPVFEGKRTKHTIWAVLWSVSTT